MTSGSVISCTAKPGGQSRPFGGVTSSTVAGGAAIGSHRSSSLPLTTIVTHVATLLRCLKRCKRPRRASSASLRKGRRSLHAHAPPGALTKVGRCHGLCNDRRMFRLHVLAFAFSACATSYVETRLGEPHPPRPESCEIDWLSIDASPANDHDEIAMLSNMNVGPNPSSAEAREQVRRRVCALGGDAASLVASASDRATYIVWSKKARR